MAPVAGLRVALCQTAQLAARVRAVIRPCERRIDGSLVLEIELQLLAGRRQRQQAKQRCCKFPHGSSLRRKRRWISRSKKRASTEVRARTVIALDALRARRHKLASDGTLLTLQSLGFAAPVGRSAWSA